MSSDPLIKGLLYPIHQSHELYIKSQRRVWLSYNLFFAPDLPITRDALFRIQALIQRTRDANSNIFVRLIDIVKAFDKVQQETY